MKSLHVNGDNYVNRGMQTFNEVTKNKDVQVAYIKHSNAECQANSWDIHDVYEKENAEAAAAGVPHTEDAQAALVSK